MNRSKSWFLAGSKRHVDALTVNVLLDDKSDKIHKLRLLSLSIKISTKIKTQHSKGTGLWAVRIVTPKAPNKNETAAGVALVKAAAVDLKNIMKILSRLSNDES